MRITNDSIKKMRHPSTTGAPDVDDATFQIKLYSIYSSNKLLMSSLTQLFSCTVNGRKRNSWFPRVRGKYFYALFNLAQRNQFMINSSCPVLSFILSQLCSALGCHFTRITEAFVVGGRWGGGSATITGRETEQDFRQTQVVIPSKRSSLTRRLTSSDVLQRRHLQYINTADVGLSFLPGLFLNGHLHSYFHLWNVWKTFQRWERSQSRPQ